VQLKVARTHQNEQEGKGYIIKEAQMQITFDANISKPFNLTVHGSQENLVIALETNKQEGLRFGINQKDHTVVIFNGDKVIANIKHDLPDGQTLDLTKIQLAYKIDGETIPVRKNQNFTFDVETQNKLNHLHIANRDGSNELTYKEYTDAIKNDKDFANLAKEFKAHGIDFKGPTASYKIGVLEKAITDHIIIQGDDGGVAKK
jgi:hypothetical protein